MYLPEKFASLSKLRPYLTVKSSQVGRQPRRRRHERPSSLRRNGARRKSSWRQRASVVQAERLGSSSEVVLVESSVLRFLGVQRVAVSSCGREKESDHFSLSRAITASLAGAYCSTAIP